MMRTMMWSPMLLAVALSPAFLQSDCSPKTGNPNLASLEIEAGGINRIVGFDNAFLSYSVWLDGATTITIRGDAEDPGSRISWELGSEFGEVGFGSGETSIAAPPDGSTLYVRSTAPGKATKSFAFTINPPCVLDECDDNNWCSTDVCNVNACEFTTVVDTTVCYNEGIAGTCSAGVCAPNPTRAWGEQEQFPSGCCAYNNPPCMVVDNAGNVTAVFQSRIAGQQSGVIHSTRYTLGGDWSPPVQLSVSGIALSPDCGIDAAGNVTAVWNQKEGVTSATPNYVWSARYTPAGGWGPAARVDPLASDPGSSPRVAVDPDGNVTVVWLQRDSGLNSVWSSRFTPTGGWGAPEVVEANQVDPAQAPQVGVDDNGNAIAVWSHGALIVANRYTPSGGWGELATLINNGFDTSNSPKAAVAANGNATVVWWQSVSGGSTIWANNYTPDGGWGLPFDEDLTNPVTIALGGTNADVVVDADGDAMAVWLDAGTIVARRYTMGGGWLAAENMGSGSGPKIAIGPSGDIALVWRGSSEWMSNRFTSGAWGFAEVISDPIGSSNIGYPVVDFAGNVTAVWEVILGVTGQYSVQWSNRFE